MEVMLAVAARGLSAHEDGTMDIVGVFDEIVTSETPCIVERMILIVSFSADMSEVGFERTMNIPLLAADGEVLGEIQDTFEVPGPRRSGSPSFFNRAYPIANIHFSSVGPYAFSILIGDDLKRTVPLYISLDEGGA